MAQKIKNRHYRQFLDEGIMLNLGPEEIRKACTNVKGKHVREGQNLIRVAYYTGARPNEYLDLASKDIKKDKSHVVISLKGSKGGLPRPVYLSTRAPGITEIWAYAQSLHPDAYLFPHYRHPYMRVVQRKNGPKEIRVTSDKLRYYWAKWFSGIVPGMDQGIPPYYLRHNRFSKLATAGASLEDIRQLKGSRTTESVMPYLHMSTDKAKKNARLIR